MTDTEAASFEIPNELREIADKLAKGERPALVTVRELLRYFSAHRRGFYIVLMIQDALDSLNIKTEPDFRDLWIDAEISFVSSSAGETGDVDGAKSADASGGGGGGGEPPPEGEAPETGRPQGRDPTLRIRTLDAANRGVISVKPDEPLSLAITRMLANDYSQLPVMTNSRIVKGIISWSTIGAGISLNNKGVAARQHMQKHYVVDHDDTFLDILPTIIEKGYVLVRGRNSAITGIVTASDVSVEFKQRAEPFLLLSEIEQHVRNIIDGKLSVEELKTVKNPADTGRTINRIADLTFYEYILIFQNPEYWEKINLDEIHKNEFVEHLQKIADIRNDVMHISVDPLDEIQLRIIQTGAKFFQQLQAFRATDTEEEA